MHVARTGERRSAYKVLVEIAEAKGLLWKIQA
jgi:hypothetical protein